jgi:hypothetical protein
LNSAGKPSLISASIPSSLVRLQSLAVGLIALAGYQLSRNTITDRCSRFVLFIPAAVGIGYTAQWLYPVLIVVGGLITWSWDFKSQILAFLRFRPNPSPRRTQGGTSSTATPADPHRRGTDEMAIPPSPSAGVPLDLPSTPTPQTTTSGVFLRAEPQRSSSGGRPLAPGNQSAMSITSNPSSEKPTPNNFTVPLQTSLIRVLSFLAATATLIAVKATVKHTPRALPFFINMFIAGRLLELGCVQVRL